jgi:hypothetical protein
MKKIYSFGVSILLGMVLSISALAASPILNLDSDSYLYALDTSADLTPVLVARDDNIAFVLQNFADFDVGILAESDLMELAFQVLKPEGYLTSSYQTAPIFNYEVAWRSL